MVGAAVSWRPDYSDALMPPSRLPSGPYGSEPYRRQLLSRKVTTTGVGDADDRQGVTADAVDDDVGRNAQTRRSVSAYRRNRFAKPRSASSASHTTVMDQQRDTWARSAMASSSARASSLHSTLTQRPTEGRHPGLGSTAEAGTATALLSVSPIAGVEELLASAPARDHATSSRSSGATAGAPFPGQVAPRPLRTAGDLRRPHTEAVRGSHRRIARARRGSGVPRALPTCLPRRSGR
jgi:hypothetical protein